MRFLLDMGISPKVIGVLESLGHDAVRCADLGMFRTADTDILAHAQAEGRILISTDLDFANLAVACRQPCPGLILLRLENPSWEIMCSRLQVVLTALPEDEILGSIVVIQRNKVRIRKL